MTVKVKLVWLISLLLVTSPALPAEPAAAVGKLTSRGTTEVNGTAMPSEATVFSGDRIATRKDSTVALAFGGGNQVFFPEMTEARVERAGTQTKVRLERGALAVISRSGKIPVVEANGVRIEAGGSAPAVFEVALQGAALKVLTRSGTAVVTAANRTVEVPEGKMLDAVATPPQNPPLGAGMGAGLSTIQVVALATAVAAGITGLVLGAVALTRPNPEDCTIVGSSPAKIKCP